MKFLKIITPHTQDEMENIEASMSDLDKDLGSILEKKFKSEFFEVDGKVGLFIISHENYIKEILDFYTKIGVDVSNCEDITKDALYGKIDTTPYVEGKGGIEYNLVEYYLENFIDSNLDIDTVLEKISELGKESLNKKDMLVLKNI